MPKRDQLVFVVGGSPAVVTETIYCLLDTTFEPTDVWCLTTTLGARALRRHVLGARGAWQRMRCEYAETRRFALDTERIVLLRGPDGRPLDDVRSADDVHVAGDQICEFVRRHTTPRHGPLHASIAGGRKTLGYLLAASMMLFGRQTDRLSHVLIEPADLENTNFYFPPSHGRAVSYRTKEGRTIRVRARDIRVELADLPYPKLGAIHAVRTVASERFYDLVCNLQHDLESLARPTIELDPAAGAVVCAGRRVRLSPLQYAIYELLTLRRRDGCQKPNCPGCAGCFLPAEEISANFRVALRESLKARASHAVGKQWDERNFRAERAKINARLRRALRNASEPYTIVIRGRRGKRLYGVGLRRNAIAPLQR